MSLGLRSWLFAVTILLVAEDFQYVLKIGSIPALEQRAGSQNSLCEACEEGDNEGKNEKEEEEKKEEKKEKDENKNDGSDSLLNIFSRLAKIKFRDAILPLSGIAHELETPPPEV